MRSRHLLSSAFAVILLAGAAIPSSASVAKAADAYLPLAEYTNGSVRARSTIARFIARLGVLSIRGAGPAPSTNDYILTATLLDAACELDPSNLDILRRAIDAWHGAADSERASELTARLVEIDPTDTVAQLRLISTRLNRLQTADDRIAAYDRIIGPSGASLDAAIRSRLALDAALLARERGDEDGFLSRLTRATQLDSSNKDAAALAASVVMESSEDPLARSEALLNVVLADPMDASSHANLASELRNAGAFSTAQRFQDNADAIYAAEGRYYDPELTYDRMLTLWGRFGPEAVADALDDRERAMRANRANEVAAYIAAGQQPPPGAAPEQVTLEPILEVLRAAANISLGRASRVETTARLMTREAGELQRLIAEAAEQGATEEQILQASERLKIILSELLWLRVWAGVQTAEADGLLLRMQEAGFLTDPQISARYKGFIAVREGDFARAQELLQPLAAFDPRARIGLALLDEARGNPRSAAAQLAPLAMGQTGSMLGLYARSSIERLLNSPVAPTASATRIQEYFRSVPTWLDAMTRDPREFMVMDATWPAQSLSLLDGMPLTIRLRNIGRIPLSVGPKLSINSRLLLSPDPSIGGEKPQNPLPPEVAEFSRTLRVMPGQSTEVVVSTDLGAVGAALDSSVTQIATIRWQVAQGFLVDQRGVFYKGPTSVSASSPLLTRRQYSIPDESVAGIRRALDGAQGDRIIEVLAVFRDLAYRTLSLEDRQLATQITSAILQTVAQHMPTMNELDRAAAVLLVASVYPREFLTPIDEAALADPSQLVRLVALAARVNNPDHPAFESLIADGSDDMDALVISLRQRLREAAVAAQRRQESQQNAPGANPAGQSGGLRFDPTAK